MGTTNFLEEIIDQKVIENCEINNACAAGLTWLKVKPRTYADLRKKSMEWYQWLSCNSTLPAVLEKLALDSDAYVRRYVAQNAQVPAAVLEKLALDSDADVRRGVAQNAQAPAAVLEKLALDSDADVRRGVAQNAQAPAAVLEKLALDSDADVRWYVAQNAQAPAAVLEKLALDSDADVRRGAKKALRKLEEKSA
jgi:antitoxin component of MazEF toxin-antitoxin module